MTTTVQKTFTDHLVVCQGYQYNQHKWHTRDIFTLPRSLLKNIKLIVLQKSLAVHNLPSNILVFIQEWSKEGNSTNFSIENFRKTIGLEKFLTKKNEGGIFEKFSQGGILAISPCTPLRAGKFLGFLGIFREKFRVFSKISLNLTGFS